MKHEWRKKEKEIYLPKQKPAVIEVPTYNFITIEGEGSPAHPDFAEYISVLYSLSYGVKMNLKKGIQPEGYYDYTVYPLEGVWDLNEEARKAYDGTFNKEDLVFKLMIRQPNFVKESYVKEIFEMVERKKPHKFLHKAKFEQIDEGKCVQMLHLGSYDDEPATFKIMEDFAIENNLERITKMHREIYLSDFRKVAPEKLKTVLRFQVKTLSPSPS